jgi:hypothetical protein
MSERHWPEAHRFAACARPRRVTRLVRINDSTIPTMRSLRPEPSNSSFDGHGTTRPVPVTVETRTFSSSALEEGTMRRCRDSSWLSVVIGVTLVGVALGACSGTSGSSAAPSAGRPIPVRVPPPPPSAPTITTPQGGPAVTEFNAPASFTCMTQDPSQAQVTIGWSAPSATQVAVVLDGVQPPSGLRPSVPYEVPAGPASGPGVTVVLACAPAVQHTIMLEWRTKGSPATVRLVSLAKATTP